MKKILLSTGGTGGHVFPAISLAEELKTRGYEIHLISDLRGQKYLNSDLNTDLNIIIHIIDIHISKANIIKFVKSVLQLVNAIFKSIFLIYKIKPDIVIGFGGYPTFAPLLASTILNVPIVLYEQNSFIGKSNRIFARFAKKIALSYKQTINVCDKYSDKLILTGDIVRGNIKSLKPKNDFRNDDFNILIFGGSQGAKIFSTLVPESIRLLLINHPNLNISITQQVSKTEQEEVEKFYKELGIKYEISEFFHDIYKKYEKAQLVISRSGASTIAELTYIGLPAIFIPYPCSAENHQLHNAMQLSALDASWYFEQEKVNPIKLSEKIFELATNRKLLKSASTKLLQRKSDGVKILSNTIEKIIS